MIIYEYICSGNPLSVELSPHCFSPAGVGNGEMEAVFFQIVPETTGYDMPQWISEVVCNHLRLSGCSAGEVHQ